MTVNLLVEAALKNALDPEWDGCIGEETARVLGKELIALRQRHARSQEDAFRLGFGLGANDGRATSKGYESIGVDEAWENANRRLINETR